MPYATAGNCPPSIVVGHTHHGCRPSSSIFWVFSMGLMLQKFMCSMEDRIDVIPVDYCADALLMLLNQPLAHGEVVHISAEENSVKFAEIDGDGSGPSRRRWG